MKGPGDVSNKWLHINYCTDRGFAFAATPQDNNEQNIEIAVERSQSTKESSVAPLFLFFLSSSQKKTEKFSNASKATAQFRKNGRGYKAEVERSRVKVEGKCVPTSGSGYTISGECLIYRGNKQNSPKVQEKKAAESLLHPSMSIETASNVKGLTNGEINGRSSSALNQSRFYLSQLRLAMKQ
ncbi:unnamed protein product [Clavelina lepadiformis]|uniref:Uncharacterized protein n=1 Tax=Clavelina lepadiformis TaxID=159417 RepID=A0ABP0GNN7_CLALP